VSAGTLLRQKPVVLARADQSKDDISVGEVERIGI
jgi:hypothetical protein